MCHHVVVAARVDLICVEHMFDAQDMMHFSSVKRFTNISSLSDMRMGMVFWFSIGGSNMSVRV